MKKDLDKLFSKSIETYYFLLLIVVIIKLLGGNYFEMNLSNPHLVRLNDIIKTFYLENVWYTISIYINVYIVTSITCNDSSKNMKKYVLYWLPLIIFFQFMKNGNKISVLIDIFYPLLIAFIKNKRITKDFLSNYLFIVFLMNIIQIISMVIRNDKLWVAGGNFIIDFVYNLDFLISLIIVYKLYFYKGGKNLCGMVVYSGSQKLISLRDSLKDLLKNSQNKKPKSKEEKITNAIYLPLYILWNLFTMLIIILIAFLNDAFIEAIFITVAFWVNKFAFGKPFHFKSVAVCFAFSSVTYYVLTRITFKTETSFFIPIFLGVALSYVTSHFIKKNTKLYKGMVEEEFYDVVKQVEDDKLTIKMLKEYYCDRQKDSYISMQNGYSIDSVRKKRQNVNKKLKSLQ